MKILSGRIISSEQDKAKTIIIINWSISWLWQEGQGMQGKFSYVDLTNKIKISFTFAKIHGNWTFQYTWKQLIFFHQPTISWSNEPD